MPPWVFQIPVSDRFVFPTIQMYLYLEPDIKVQNDFKSLLSGNDPQLERAVKEMLEEIKKVKKDF